MGCSKDSNCLNLYSKVYPSAKDTIDSSINTIKGELSDIETTLSELIVPDDYLGTKVQEQLAEICASFEEDESSIASLESGINTFVNSKIQEHKQHYANWKKIQDSIMAKKKEENIAKGNQTYRPSDKTTNFNAIV